MRAGAIEAERRQRVDFRVDLGDALLQRIEQVERGDLFFAQPRDELGRTRVNQLVP